jgi:glucose/arabinose dehydrogenase
MLYLGTGDGGGAGDPSGNAQNLNTLLGKMLRLDVRTLPYTVPAGNPFTGQAGRRGEIWAYGLRNPWRFAFDRGVTPAALYIADVGQDLYEEVNVVPSTSAGLNYGWNVMEGTHCYPSGDACSRADLVLPATMYSHTSGGCSITGGLVYRGAAIPEVRGHYFYSDYCAHFLVSITGSTSAGFEVHVWNVPDVGSIVSFGEDAAGELYMVSANGSVYQIAKQ